MSSANTQPPGGALMSGASAVEERPVMRPLKMAALGEDAARVEFVSNHPELYQHLVYAIPVTFFNRPLVSFRCLADEEAVRTVSMFATLSERLCARHFAVHSAKEALEAKKAAKEAKDAAKAVKALLSGRNKENGGDSKNIQSLASKGSFSRKKRADAGSDTDADGDADMKAADDIDKAQDMEEEEERVHDEGGPPSRSSVAKGMPPVVWVIEPCTDVSYPDNLSEPMKGDAFLRHIRIHVFVLDYERTDRGGRVIGEELRSIMIRYAAEDREDRLKEERKMKNKRKPSEVKDNAFAQHVRTPRDLVTLFRSYTMSDPSSDHTNPELAMKSIDQTSSSLNVLDVYSLERALGKGKDVINAHQHHYHSYRMGCFPARGLAYYISPPTCPRDIFSRVFPWVTGLVPVNLQTFKTSIELRFREEGLDRVMQALSDKRGFDQTNPTDVKEFTRMKNAVDAYLKDCRSPTTWRVGEIKRRAGEMKNDAFLTDAQKIIDEKQARATTGVDLLITVGKMIFDEAVTYHCSVNQVDKRVQVEVMRFPHVDAIGDETRRRIAASDARLASEVTAKIAAIKAKSRPLAVRMQRSDKDEKSSAPASASASISESTVIEAEIQEVNDWAVVERVRRMEEQQDSMLDAINHLLVDFDSPSSQANLGPEEKSIHRFINKYLADRDGCITSRRDVAYTDTDSFTELKQTLLTLIERSMLIVGKALEEYYVICSGLTVHLPGKFPNHCIMWGDPSAGKSAMINALDDFFIIGSTRSLSFETNKAHFGKVATRLNNVICRMDEFPVSMMQSGPGGIETEAMQFMKTRMSECRMGGTRLVHDENKDLVSMSLEAQLRWAFLIGMNPDPRLAIHPAFQARVTAMEIRAPEDAKTASRIHVANDKSSRGVDFARWRDETSKHFRFYHAGVYLIGFAFFARQFKRTEIDTEYGEKLAMSILGKCRDRLYGVKDSRNFHRFKQQLQIEVCLNAWDKYTRSSPLWDKPRKFTFKDLRKIEPFLVAGPRETISALTLCGQLFWGNAPAEEIRRAVQLNIFPIEGYCPYCLRESRGSNMQLKLKCDKHGQISTSRFVLAPARKKFAQPGSRLVGQDSNETQEEPRRGGGKGGGGKGRGRPKRGEDSDDRPYGWSIQHAYAPAPPPSQAIEEVKSIEIGVPYPQPDIFVYEDTFVRFYRREDEIDPGAPCLGWEFSSSRGGGGGSGSGGGVVNKYRTEKSAAFDNFVDMMFELLNHSRTRESIRGTLHQIESISVQSRAEQLQKKRTAVLERIGLSDLKQEKSTERTADEDAEELLAQLASWNGLDDPLVFGDEDESTVTEISRSVGMLNIQEKAVLAARSWVWSEDSMSILREAITRTMQYEFTNETMIYSTGSLRGKGQAVWEYVTFKRAPGVKLRFVNHQEVHDDELATIRAFEGPDSTINCDRLFNLEKYLHIRKPFEEQVVEEHVKSLCLSASDIALYAERCPYNPPEERLFRLRQIADCKKRGCKLKLFTELRGLKSSARPYRVRSASTVQQPRDTAAPGPLTVRSQSDPNSNGGGGGGARGQKRPAHAVSPAEVSVPGPLADSDSGDSSEQGSPKRAKSPYTLNYDASIENSSSIRTRMAELAAAESAVAAAAAEEKKRGGPTNFGPFAADLARKQSVLPSHQPDARGTVAAILRGVHSTVLIGGGGGDGGAEDSAMKD